MVSRLFEAIGDVLAPPVRTSLEEFKNHWRAITKFYVDQQHKAGSVTNSEVLDHLNQMIQLLLEESDAYDTHAGPCLEYFLQEQILAVLCMLGERDSPVGMRKLVLILVATLLRNMSVPLLHHMNIHKPVCKLLAACKGLPQVEKSEFIGLLHTLLVKIQKEDMSLACFFFESKQDEPEFLIFSSLLRYLTADGNEGELARTALLLSLSLCSVGMVSDYIASHSTFVPQMIGDLISMYRALPLTTSAPSSDHFYKLKSHIIFCGRVLASSPEEIQRSLLQSFENDFLAAVLGPSLLQPSEAASNSAMIYLAHFLPELDTKLLDSVATFLLGEYETVEKEGDEDDHLLRTTLIRRMDSLSEEVSVVSLKLFEALVSLHHQGVMNNLILRNLRGGKHLLPGVNSDIKDREAEVSAAVSAILRLFPVCNSPSDGYEAYLSDAQRAICSSATPTLRPNSIVQAAKEEGELFYEGLFLHVLFNKLERLLENSLQSNLILTSIVIRLAYFPHSVLRDFLLQPLLPLLSTSRSPYRILKIIAEEAERKCRRYPHHKETLSLVRQDLQLPAPSENLGLSDENRLFFENLIVLEEFCKELAATLHVACLYVDY